MLPPPMPQRDWLRRERERERENRRSIKIDPGQSEKEEELWLLERGSRLRGWLVSPSALLLDRSILLPPRDVRLIFNSFRFSIRCWLIFSQGIQMSIKRKQMSWELKKNIEVRTQQWKMTLMSYISFPDTPSIFFYRGILDLTCLFT